MRFQATSIADAQERMRLFLVAARLEGNWIARLQNVSRDIWELSIEVNVPADESAERAAEASRIKHEAAVTSHCGFSLSTLYPSGQHCRAT